jgi:hypothetical protein
MGWDAILLDITKALAIALASTITGYAIAGIKAGFTWLNGKIKDSTLQRIVGNIQKTIEEVVEATEQIFVKTAKEANSWDEVKKGDAFKKAFDSVVVTTNEKAKTMITAAYGDLDVWLTNKIEAYIGSLHK